MKGGHGMSNRSFERMMKAFVLFMKDNNMLRVSEPMPLGLRKKLGNLEGKGTLIVKYQLLRCATGGDKTEMCLHYWIPQIPLLVDKLVSSCIEQGEVKDSFSFSHLCNKIVIAVGCDRGGGGLVNLMQSINRECGNTAQHSIPISVVEKEAEDYDVLKRTIYNKSAKNQLLPIFLDELCTFIYYAFY